MKKALAGMKLGKFWGIRREEEKKFGDSKWENGVGKKLGVRENAVLETLSETFLEKALNAPTY